MDKKRLKCRKIDIWCFKKFQSLQVYFLVNILRCIKRWTIWRNLIIQCYKGIQCFVRRSLEANVNWEGIFLKSGETIGNFSYAALRSLKSFIAMQQYYECTAKTKKSNNNNNVIRRNHGDETLFPVKHHDVPFVTYKKVRTMRWKIQHSPWSSA